MSIERLKSESASLHSQVNLKINNSVDLSTKLQTKHTEPVALHHESIIHPENIETAVTVLNGFIDPSQTNLKFVYHEELNEYYVTVINPLTNETLKEIPPKKLLDMYAAMAEFMGILVDKKI